MSVSPVPDQLLVAFDPISTAVTGQVSATVTPKLGRVEAMHIQATFAYGAGGTTCKCWVQTSLDNGTTWIDIVCFAFTTAALIRGANIMNFVAQTTPVALTDGAMADNTGIGGFLGPIYRTKITTTGTYSGATSLYVYAVWK